MKALPTGSKVQTVKGINPLEVATVLRLVTSTNMYALSNGSHYKREQIRLKDGLAVIVNDPTEGRRTGTVHGEQNNGEITLDIMCDPTDNSGASARATGIIINFPQDSVSQK